VDIVYGILLVLHLLGMAMVVGGWLATVREPKLVPGMLHGALTTLVSGLVMVGLRESGAVDKADLNHAKIGVKLLIALVVTVLIVLAGRRSGDAKRLVPAAGGLTIVNVLVAVLWS
jgi:hypothetical protein